MRLSALLLSSALASFATTAALAQGATPSAPASTAPAAAPTPMPDSLKDPKAQVGYAIGLNIGASIKRDLDRDSISADPAAVGQAIHDVLTGAEPLLTEDQTREVLLKVQADVQARRAEKAAHAAEDNKAEGAAYLKANGAKPGVTTLSSGLQYEVLTAGTGPKPTAEDVVLCNYRGTLIDGTEFDSSYKTGQAASFPVGGVIKGWTEILQKMPTGSKWRVVIPSALAYGEHGAPPDIGPNTVLVFEIELLSIQPKG
jgi:FKBP-type peptidyl-prolyl cis-trans isomerase FklB